MTFKYIIVFIIAVNFYFAKAINFSKFSSSLFLSGSSPPPLPTPSPLAVECFQNILSQINDCRNDAIRDWNITDKSPIKDLCCAQWEVFDCDLSAAKAKCNSDEMNDVNKYEQDLVEYYESSACQEYPKGSSHCVLPILSGLSDNKPPIPPALAIDCLGNIKMKVRIGCQQISKLKWNITEHEKRPPIRNLCCAAWDDIDCLDLIVKVRCPQREVIDTEDFFKQLEDWAGKEGCSQDPYHSQSCSNASMAGIKPELKPYFPLPIPIRNDETSKVDKDYTYFMLNYIMSAFPYLLNLMILLSIILVTIVMIQCFILIRQAKQERTLADIAPRVNGYNKLLNA